MKVSGAGLGALLFSAFPMDSACADFDEVGSSNDKYEKFRVDGSGIDGNVYMSYSPRRSSEDDDFFLYVTKDDGDDNTYFNNEVPFVGINPFLKNGYRILASPSEGSGEIYLEFRKGALVGGFYGQKNDRYYGLIKNSREAVRVTIEDGKMSCLQKPSWDNGYPVMTFKDDATASVYTGNVSVKIDDGRFQKVSTRAISPLVYGATPLFLRTQKERNDLFIKSDGSVVSR